MRGWDQPIKYVWFSFSGRLNRKAYWLKGTFLLMIVYTAALFMNTLITASLSMVVNFVGATAMMISIFLTLPFFVFQSWTGLAVSVKRAHDLNHSGWWLLTGLIPFWNIWVFIQLWFLRGSDGANRFGPDPLDFHTDSGDESVPHAYPHPPQGGDEVGGFGTRTSQPGMPAATTPTSSSVPDMPSVAQREPDPNDADPTGNRDIISRRLGNDILRPIQRKPRG